MPAARWNATRDAADRNSLPVTEVGSYRPTSRLQGGVACKVSAAAAAKRLKL